MREDFRNFRIDRIGAATLAPAFTDEPGRTLRDMMVRYGEQAVRMLEHA